MNSIWRSLLWKEWREHRWQLGALVAIAVVVPVMLSIKTPGNIFGAVTFTLTLAVPLGAMFIGMHAAASERSQGTIRFLQALPTPLAKPAAAKLIWAAITVLAPVVAAVVGAGLWKAGIVGSGRPDDVQLAQGVFGRPWGLTDWYAATLVSGGAGGLSIVIWMAAAGVNRSDEVRAGAIGLLAILACWGGADDRAELRSAAGRKAVGFAAMVPHPQLRGAEAALQFPLSRRSQLRALP